MPLFYDLPFAEYCKIDAWNWSAIKLLENGSPKHALHARTHPSDDTAARGMLRAIHCLTLELHRFNEQFAVFDGHRRGKVFDAFAAENAGKTLLNPAEHAQAVATSWAIAAHEPARRLLSEGRPEVTVTWTDEATGLPCKGRIDWLGPNGIVDLKTLGTTNERQIGRLVASNLYHGQLAHYCAGLAANGINVPAYLVVAEGKGAQDVAVFHVDDGEPAGALCVGRKMRDKLMKRLAEAVRDNAWVGRHPTEQLLSLPLWAYDDAMDDLVIPEER